MAHDLPKAYDPGAIEAHWADYWVKEKVFSVATPSGALRHPIFSILLPPPNVTGRLHMGHMLNHTEIDILTRWHRMRGDLSLWLPGTDHAGIATQMMVERQLADEGKTRRDLGREAFVERVWEWKRHYGGLIQEQMKRLGDSVDWDREYFTMDKRLSRAVIEAFLRLHEEGLIYRGKYVVNWCPRCMTAISDLEVKHEETAGKLYEIRYPVVGSNVESEVQDSSATAPHDQAAARSFLTIATTRPETMLGDTAVAVNPDDERYRALHGRFVLLPLMNRILPVVADDWVNPEFGTGAVKVTPAHDPNDYEIAQRHKLESIDVMDDAGRMNSRAEAYAGLDRFEARAKILADLEAQGLLGQVREHTLSIGRCDRCNTIVEPRLSTQWFVKARPLAERALAASQSGEIRFFPEQYKKVFDDWMANIHDWCVSRQLWWGHRIPAWHCQTSGCAETVVSRAAPAACAKCAKKNFQQESDVLDTWFSAGLLPFAVLGWPDKTRDLEFFYPASLMVTGFDIIFFWVARMVMLGCHFMRDHTGGSVPFRQVYIHALVRDAERQKMSKTKGNVLDPIEVIKEYGTDAVRFTLAAMASPGTDIAFSRDRTAGYRAFANKIWNAARFIFMNVDRATGAGVWSLADFSSKHSSGKASSEIPPASTLEDKWILSRLHAAAQQTGAALDAYRFHEAAHVVYSFFWGDFCDWYIEIIKPRLLRFDSQKKEETRNAFFYLVYVFEAALRLLSPFMPFITEEIWHAIYDGKTPLKSIALAAYPVAGAEFIDSHAENEMRTLQELIEAVRNLRAERGVESRMPVPIEVFAQSVPQRSGGRHAAGGDSALIGFRHTVEQNSEVIKKLAGVESITFREQPLSSKEGTRSTPLFDVSIVYEKKIDVAAERERITKELGKMETEIANARRQLQKQEFLERAPAAVVDGIRQRARELEALIEKARHALSQLR